LGLQQGDFSVARAGAVFGRAKELLTMRRGALRSGAIVSQCATEEGQRSKPAGALSPLLARNVLGKLVELRGGCDGTTTAKAQTNLKLAARFRIELAHSQRLRSR